VTFGLSDLRIIEQPPCTVHRTGLRLLKSFAKSPSRMKVSGMGRNLVREYETLPSPPLP